MKLTTNYGAHERAYQARLQAGKKSWDSSEEYASFFANLSEIVSLKYFEKETRWLELGCGAGDVSQWLAQKGVHVTGVEISQTAVDLAREKFKLSNNVGQFFVLDVTKDWLCLKESDKFDVILDSHVLHCIIGEHRKALFENIKKYLAENGILIVATMCGSVTNIPSDNTDYHFSYPILWANGIAQRHIAMADDIVEEVQDAGFCIEKRTLKIRATEEEQDELFLVLRRSD